MRHLDTKWMPKLCVGTDNSTSYLSRYINCWMLLHVAFDHKTYILAAIFFSLQFLLIVFKTHSSLINQSFSSFRTFLLTTVNNVFLNNFYWLCGISKITNLALSKRYLILMWHVHFYIKRKPKFFDFEKITDC